MKKVSFRIAGMLVACALLSSCYVNTFNVGKGAQSNVKVTKWNHYLIEGLAPVSVANPQQMAGGATDYTVTIKHSFVNMLVGGVTFGIYTPTTTVVEK